MVTCERCCELLWEHLYGLLEDPQSEGLHDHLASCASCQSQLAQAEGQRRLLTEAARLEVNIPLFLAPEADGEPIALGFPTRPVRKTRRPLKWAWLAAAAALLLTVGLPYGFYRRGLARHETALREADERFAQVVAQVEESHQKARLEAETLAFVKRASHLHLQVFGPADYLPGVPCQYQIRTSDLNGVASKAHVTARLVGEDRQVLAEATDLSSEGNLLACLTPASSAPPRGLLRLEVSVHGKQDLEFQQPLHVLDSMYVTHLTLDKAVYRPGEKVFFRSLTLESYGLGLPRRPLKVAYTVTDPQGKTVHESKGETVFGGIGGGQFSLTHEQPEGEYTLSVADADNRFPAVTRRFLVRPEGAPRKTLVGTGAFQVEFYPEGGDLIAGVPNRIYFRVYNPEGGPVNLEGTLMDGQGREITRVRSAGTNGEDARTGGLGLFTFTPQAGENYHLRIRSPAGIGAGPELPPVRENGLALSVPTSVSRAEEPIRAVLRQNGTERQVMVGVFCRGRLVAQEALAVQAGFKEVEISLPVGCHGVLRVAVFDLKQGLLQPIAERLVYRIPTERLNLAVENLKERYRPGETVKLTVRSMDDKGTPLAAWLLASVVDASAEGPASPSGLGHLLMPESDGSADLGQADLLFSRSHEGAASLDLFLGTQSLHRMAAQDAKTAVTVNRGKRSDDGKKALAAVVRLDNLDQAMRDAEAAIGAALASLQQSMIGRDRELAEEGERRLGEAQGAARTLYDYQARTAENFRLALTVGVIALFGTGCTLLTLVLVRVVRGRSANTPYLGGAFATLLLCVFTLMSPANPWRESGFARKPDESPFAEGLPNPLDLQALYQATSRSLSPSPQLASSPPQRQPDEAPFGRPALVYREEKISASTGMQPVPVGPSRQRLLKVGSKGQYGPSPPPPGSRLPEYVHTRSSAEAPQTLLWRPALYTVGGTAEVTFDLPEKAGMYRIRVEGHTGSGSLGTFEAKVDCRLEGAGTEKESTDAHAQPLRRKGGRGG